MPSILGRLAGLVPSYRGLTAAPAPAPTRRERPDVSAEKVPHLLFGSRQFLLPYGDSTSTDDTPEIRAAMRRMLRDPYVKSGWFTQVFGVAAQEFQIHHPDARKSELAQRSVDLCRHALEAVDGGFAQGVVFPIVMNLGSDGFTLSEKVGDLIARGKWANHWTLKALRPKDPEDLSLVADEFRNVTGVRVTRTGETWPISDFVYARYMHLFDEPMGMAAFRGAYAAYWMRDTIRKLRAIHHEKHAGGVWLGTYEDPADRTGLEAALARVRHAMWAAVPAGVRMEVVQRSAASEADWKSFDESLREEILVGVALAHLHILQGGVSDARGNTKVHKEVSDLGPWLLTYVVQETINRQIIPDLCDYNLSGLDEYPRVTLGGVTNQEVLEQFQILDAAQRAGFRPSRTHYAQVLTIQESDPEDPTDQLTPPQAGGPMGGLGGGMGAMLPPGGGGDPFGGMGGGGAMDPFAGAGGDGASLAAFAEGGPDVSEVVDAVKAFTPEQLDGLYVYGNRRGPAFWIDQMDWHDGEAGREIIELAEKVLGVKAEDAQSGSTEVRLDKPAVYVCNEGPKPPGDGWVDLLDESAVKKFSESVDLTPVWESFGWTAAKSRTGGVKAVGTGEDAGRVVYGKRAQALLARGSAAAARGATSSGGQPQNDPPPAPDRDTLHRAAAGDLRAREAVEDHAADRIEAAAAEMGRAPHLPPAGAKAVTDGLAASLFATQTPRGAARTAVSFVGRLLADAGHAAGHAARFTGWLLSAGASVAVPVVKALARAAWWLTKRGGAAVLSTLGEGAAALLGPAVRSVARWTPFVLTHLATVAAGAALLGGIALGVPYLPLPFFVKLGVGVGGIAATATATRVYAPRLMRRLSGEAFDRAAHGQGIYTGDVRDVETGRPVAPHSETFSEAGFLADVEAFAEWEEFAWADWTRIDGGKWKSPGGRVLTDPVYQRLKGGAGGKSSPAQRRALRTQAPPRTPDHGRVYQLDPNQIAVDPARFQFKLGTDAATGTGKELAEVRTFNPELAGVVAVWRDPADGKTYVVNGHHRLELAKRTGHPSLSVRYLRAATAEEARAKGALINIAEGRGTAVDAAKFLRDTGRTVDDLRAVGVSLSGPVARDAAALVRLDPDLFRRVAVGAVPVPLAVTAARHLDDPADQRQFVARVEQQEGRTGRPLAARVADELAREMAIAPRVTPAHQTLFGPADDESAWVHRAEIKSYVRTELAKEARDFALAASARRAQALTTVAGNALNVQANRRVADRATAALDDFDAAAHLKGPLSDLLNTFAVEYANAGPAQRHAIRLRAVGAVRAALSGDVVRPVVGGGGRRPGLFDGPPPA